MVKINSSAVSFIDQPCERCGSKKSKSKSWNELLETISVKSFIQVSQIVCTNSECQAVFDKNQAKELIKINERKLKKEEQDKIRKENIVQTIARTKRDTLTRH